MPSFDQYYGLGKGNAQVFPSSPQIQLYGQLIAKRQAEKVAEEKALADKLTNLNTNGLREADKEQYYKMYNDWRTEEQKGYGLKGQDKFNSQASAQKLYSQLNGLVANSKAKTVRDLEIGKTLLTNPYAVNDEGSVVYHKSLAAPTGSTEDIVDYTPYRGYDTSKALPIVKAIQKSVFDTAKPDQLPTLGKEYTAQGKTFTPTSTRYTTDNDYYARQIATAAMATKETEGLLRTAYPNLPWRDDHEGAVMQAAHLYAADNPVTVPDKIGTPIQKDKPVDKSMTDWQRYLISRGYPFPPGSAPDKVNSTLQARLKMIQDMQNRVPASGEILGAFIEGNPEFDQSSKFKIGKDLKHPTDADKFSIYVPAKVKWDPAKGNSGGYVEVIPKTTYDFSYRDPNFVTKMNSLISNVSGEHIDIGSLGLKGNTHGTTVKATVKPATGQYKAGDKSYSHADLLKMGYTEDQIGEALKRGTLKR